VPQLKRKSMKKADLIAQLEGAKALTSVVSIDNVIALIQGLDPEVRIEKVLGITAELAEDIALKIERFIDCHCDDLFNLDSAEFELSYCNQIKLTRVDFDTDELMERITATLEKFVIQPDEEVDEDQLDQDILAGNEAAQED